MCPKLSQTITEISAFSNKHRIEAEFHLHRVSELNGGSPEQDANWKKFEGSPGVYCIFNESADEVRYIGSSLVQTGYRIFNWLFKEGGAVQQAIQPQDIILSIVMPENYMAPALESYLIGKLNPVLNRKK